VRAIRQAEGGASRTMIDRTGRRVGIRPEWRAADTACGDAENLGWLVEARQITPGLRAGPGERPVHLSGRSRASPVPAGLLRSRARQGCHRAPDVPGARVRLREMSVEAALLPEGGGAIRHQGGTRGRPGGRENVSGHKGLQSFPRQAEEGRDALRAPRAHPEPHPPEAPRLRGPNGARGEFLLAATAQNLRKLAKLRPSTAETAATA
jgi:hypothetical protein